MRSNVPAKDLVILAADNDMEQAVKGLLDRHHALGIRQVSFDIFRHLARDSGCFSSAHEFLRQYARDYAYALVLLDRHGSGHEETPREALEEEVEHRLSLVGWAGRAAVIVVDPELEAWVWSDSPNVDEVLGWRGRCPPLRAWLVNQGLLTAGRPKPQDPGTALEEALKAVGKPLSSSLYLRLAERVSVQRCSDGAFLKLREVLAAWFPGAAQNC